MVDLLTQRRKDAKEIAAGVCLCVPLRLCVLASKLLLVLLVVGACSRGDTEAAPPEIAYGETICEDCNMIISDARYAAGLAHEIEPGRYESLPFDDIGDMLNHASKHPDRKVVAWYVHDFNSEEWLDATQAVFVYSAQIQSPMASGTVAFADRDDAQEMAAQNAGEVLTWDEVRARFDSGQLFIGADAAGGASDQDAASGHVHGHDAVTETKASMQGNMEMQADEVMLGTAETGDLRLELVAHAPLQAGYNEIMVHATDADGAPIQGLALSFAPVISMADGTSHAAPAVEPAEMMPGMYHGAVVFTMSSGDESGAWSLTVGLIDANGALTETVFDLEVAPSARIGSFEAPDGSRIFLAAVQPVSPTVGGKPFEVFAFEEVSITEWSPVEGLILEIAPEMPEMEHGSLHNVDPVHQGGGRYLGEVNFSMAGLWTVTVSASEDSEVQGSVVLEYDVP